jgi:hypothetical protein
VIKNAAPFFFSFIFGFTWVSNPVYMIDCQV